jgi:hypothetical protein
MTSVKEYLLLSNTLPDHVMHRKKRTYEQWTQHVVQGLAYSWGLILFTRIDLGWILCSGLFLIAIWDMKTLVKWNRSGWMQRVDMFHDIISKSLGVIVGLIVAWFWG